MASILNCSTTSWTSPTRRYLPFIRQARCSRFWRLIRYRLPSSRAEREKCVPYDAFNWQLNHTPAIGFLVGYCGGRGGVCKGGRLIEKIDRAAELMGLLQKFVYANYAGRHQKPLQTYWRQNHQFLKGVIGKYDPKGVFQRQVPGVFKLGTDTYAV